VEPTAHRKVRTTAHPRRHVHKPTRRCRRIVRGGERLLYALGQLYRRSRAGELDVDPNDFDIENVTRIIGGWREVEFVQTDSAGVAYHFPSEVLCVDPGRAFPWRLKGVWEWAVRHEFRLENDDFD
jgi:hypothetical protein